MPEIIRCYNCNKETYYGLPACPHCGASFKDEQNQKIELHLRQEIESAKVSGDWSNIPTETIAKLARHIVLTTGLFVHGRIIEKELDIITAECAFGINILHDLFADFSDFFGGRSQTTQKYLRNARKICLTELRREALTVRADAVISVDLDYSEISGRGRSMLFLIASGTAVKLKPVSGSIPNAQQ